MDHAALLKGLLAQGYSQAGLAEALDTTQPTISRWMKGQNPDYKKFQMIVDLARENHLLGEDPDQTSRKAGKPTRTEIPEIDLIAGLGGGGLAALEVTASNGITFAAEVVRDHWRLPDWMLNRMNVRPAHVAAFPSRGDSMSPTIEDGDVVFVDTRHRVPSPPGVYALADEFGGVVVKRLEVTSRPGDETVTVRISSDNPLHRERELTLPEIQIVGRYIGRFTI